MFKSVAMLAMVLLLFVGADATVARQGPGSKSGASANLSKIETAYLVFMREEEKLARDSYLVLDDLWHLTVFANIAQSEQQHMDAVKNMLDKHGIKDPVTDEEDIGTFVNGDLQDLFDDLMAGGDDSELSALTVGGIIEETDMRDIQEAIDATSHLDVKRVYESLLCGSRSHLRSFVKNIQLSGETYVATVLTQEEVDAIAYSPMERCGR